MRVNGFLKMDFLNPNKKFNLFELYEMCKDKELTVKFLESRGLLNENMSCPICNWGMRKCGDYWKCHKYIKSKQGKRKCEKKVSIRKGTWFGKTKLSYGKVLLLTYMLTKNYQQILIADELKLSRNTVSQWSIFFKQIIIEWFETDLKPLGGPGKTVEVDEYKFGRRKYYRGHAVEGQWVFGAIERESKNIVLIPIEDRSAKTLTTLIQKWILPETTVISDCWKEYKNLDKHGYEHLAVNHSVNFVDVEAGAHTNVIKSTWRHAKVFLPAYNRKKENFKGYLAHFCIKYRAKQEKKELFNMILEQISKLNFNNIDIIDKNKCENENESENESQNESKVTQRKILKKRKKE